MNAFTSSDHTTYPFATTNRKDFNNLMSVYLDATLHPLLNESDFAQEGWRVGPENPSITEGDYHSDDASDNFVFKGVVYNEMKGQMSDATYLYYIRFQDHIFPDINNSGGDPQQMTDLTYSNLKDFHAQNYHPSQAKLFTYGDMPLADHLLEVGRQLDKFQKTRANKAIKLPITLDGPLNVCIKGPTDPLVDRDKQFKTSISWIMGDASDILESFSLRVMSSLLLDGYGSPLYRRLIETGLGHDWSPNTGLDNGGKVGIFSVGLNGVREDDVSKVKEAVKSTLVDVHRRGFDRAKVDGILHQLELVLKHKTANFGMGLMQRLQSGWFNGVDPFDSLAWNEIVEAFKRKLESGSYLERLVEKYLLNGNTLTFTMEPSATYGEEVAEEEAKRLAGKITEVSKKFRDEKEARKHIKARELELLEVQEKAKNENLNILPTVHVSDIPRNIESKPTRNSAIGNVNVQWREAPTNGLTYFRAINILDSLSDELRLLIPLYTDSIMRLGTKGKTMEQLEDLIKLNSGGISSSYYSSTSPTDHMSVREGLSFSGYALDHNIPAMYELLRTILLETNFEGAEAESKIRELLQSSASGALDSIASAGHSYARRFAEAGLTPQGKLNEQIGGLTQVRHTAAMAHRSSTNDLGDIISGLKAIQRLAISNSSNLRAAVTCSPDATSNNEAALQRLLSTLPSSHPFTANQASSSFYPRNSKTFFPLPYQVYYSALALPTVPYTHSSSASLQILSQLLTHKHLHREIREKGGAYGGGAYARGLGGIFGFYSYRDPNPQNTLNVLQDAGRLARDKDWTEQDIEEAKLSVFQGVDAPESVSEEGMTNFLSGVDEFMEQKKREELLDVRKSDVRQAAQEFLVERFKDTNVAVLGEQKEWVKDTDGWHISSMEMAQASESAVDDANSAV